MSKMPAYCSAGLFAALLAGCGENPIAARAPSEPTWKLLATGETFVDVWGCSPNAVFALGEASLFFYNGSSWTVLPDPPGPVESPQRYSAGSTAIWGTSPENLFVIVDTETHGEIYHNDGHAWEVVADRPFPHLRLFDIWGSSDRDVFVAGGLGLILHYDGSAWSQMSSGTSSDLRCLWGTSSSDVFAAGSEGTVLHYDGSAWTSMSAEPRWFISSIWAGSSSDVYCIGKDPTSDSEYNGAILHFDGLSWGLTWRPVIGEPWVLWNVWGSSSTDIFAVGDYGILHFDGATWSPMSGFGLHGRDIWGSSSRDVFVVGGYPDHPQVNGPTGSLLSHYDGTTWRDQVTSPAQYSWPDLTGVCGSSATDVWFIGGGREEWRSYPSIRHFDGSSFDTQWAMESEGFEYVDVWAAAPDAVFAVADDRRVDRYDAALKRSGTWELDYDPIGVWAKSRDGAFVAGSNGRISHYDGSTWSPMTTGTTSNLNDIWGSSETDVFVVGVTGTILHYDGSSWALMTTETSANLLGVWGSSSTDVYAVGDAGTILHYDGVQWMAVPSMTQNRLTGVWGSSDRDVYVVGGVILHYDGQIWTTMSTSRRAHKVWGSSAGDVYVTEGNRILHYGPK